MPAMIIAGLKGDLRGDKELEKQWEKEPFDVLNTHDRIDKHSKIVSYWYTNNCNKNRNIDKMIPLEIVNLICKYSKYFDKKYVSVDEAKKLAEEFGFYNGYDERIWNYGYYYSWEYSALYRDFNSLFDATIRAALEKKKFHNATTVKKTKRGCKIM